MRLRDLSWAVRKGLDFVELERELAAAVELSPRERVRFALAGHLAVGRNAHEVRYLGKDLVYDNRFMPLLLPAYLGQLRRIRHALGPTEIHTVLDVGANIGQFAATLVWQFPDAHVWSFEPNQQIFPLLARNASQHANWHPLPFGVGATDEEVDLWSVEGKSGQGSVRRDNATAGLLATQPSPQRVPMRRLTGDRLRSLEIPTVVDLLKIDVEGAEASALAGLADVSWRFLVIETSVHSTRGLTLEGAVDLIHTIWGTRPTLVWNDEPSEGASTADAMLELRSDPGRRD